MKLNKDSKEMAQFIASLFVLLAGIVLVFIGLFMQPVGVIHYTVLSAFGLFLTFVGAVWQLDVKYTFKMNEIEKEWDYRERMHWNRMPKEEVEDYEKELNEE